MKTSLSPEVKRLILERVSSGRYDSADEVVRRGLTLLQKQEEMTTVTTVPGSGDLAGAFADIAADVPDSNWRKVPSDLSRHLDHYLYESQETS
ncbi:MAG TPA: type II toxin-antitoxin system ParD family antitoxin [Acidobacteriaceae bacterium]|nr:type II toxin-antitoxin system ParD family antitoxin [Acidobacteriaceae bacterium]